MDALAAAPDTLPTTYRDPAPFTVAAHDHELSFYPAGLDRRAALLALIDGAAASLDVCFYIFAEDASGIVVRDALVAAARRGVRVRVMIDGFGSNHTRASFFDPLRAAGGEF